MAYQDAALEPVVGELLSVVDGEEILGTLTEMFGVLGVTVSGHERINAEAITMEGTLDGDMQTVMYIDTYAAMYGFLGAEADASERKSVVICPDIEIEFIAETIEIDGCIIGETMNLTRYRGDTYPLQAKLGKNGDYTITGVTFKMSTQIGDGTIYTSDGVIIDADKGLVEFPFVTAAIDTAGSGSYDIQGDNGYLYTYVKGTFTLLDDLTV